MTSTDEGTRAMAQYRPIAPADAALRAVNGTRASKGISIAPPPGYRGTLASLIIATARAQQAAHDSARHAAHRANGVVTAHR